mmetsp:Transcript_50815/g.118011  ORF Transcript_50815/g.118011 Transcript_50815/m.118011 type:complete len:184 (-) Transcript_50815:81-632(-)
MALMVGLAYCNLLIPWLPLLAMQCAAILHMGRTVQSAVRGLTKLFIDTPLCNFYKILWIAMFVLFLDCLRQIAMPRSPSSAGAVADAERNYEEHAAREGALAWAMNLAVMVAVMTLHVSNGECMRLEADRNIMKKQAEQANAFAQNLMASEEKKPEATVAPETKMPVKGSTENKDESELRNRG